MRYGLLVWALVAAAVARPALADQPRPIRVTMQVGQTRQLSVVAAHHQDCSTNNDRAVDVTTPPRLGRLTQRDNAPVVIGTSLSNTCMGAHITGIAVDYTSLAAGTDTFSFDGVFSNGRAHWDVTVISR